MSQDVPYTPFGSRKLSPLELTEDEAETLMTGLEQQISEAETAHWIRNTAKSREYVDFLNKLYDKIKEAK